MGRQHSQILVTLLVAIAVLMGVPVIPVRGGAAPIIPGVSLAEIPLGAPIAEVVARFGAPSQVRVATADGALAYEFGQYGITAYTRSNTVIALTTTNSVVASVQGIDLGVSLSAVIATFGPVSSTGIVEGFSGPMYPALGIAFGLDRNAVAAIMVFPVSAGAAPPQGPAPVRVPPSVNSRTPAQATAGAPPMPDAPMAASAAPAPSTPPPMAPGAPAVLSGPGAPAIVTTVPGTAAGPGLPEVASLHPYTAQTRYLSLAGYLRYLIFGMTRTWVVPEDSERLVLENQRLSSP